MSRKELHISSAAVSDLDELLRIENASFTCPWSEESFLEALASDAVRVYVCRSDGGEILGFACLLTAADEGELLNIASDPAVRRFGVGRALLARCLEDCEKNGIGALYLEVRESNLPARSLYASTGFEEIGVRRGYYTKPRESAILMRHVFPMNLEGQS